MSTDQTHNTDEREFIVYLTTGATYAVAVLATSAEEAEEKAEMQGAPGLCHQCSAVDLGDWMVDSDLTESPS